MIERNFQNAIEYVLAPPGSGRFTLLASKLGLFYRYWKEELIGRAEINAIGDGTITYGFARDTKLTLEDRTALSKSGCTSGKHFCVAKTSHAIARLHKACKNANVHNLTIIKCDKDSFDPLVEKQGITAEKALEEGKYLHLGHFIFCTIDALHTCSSKLLAYVDPVVIYFLEASSMLYKDLIDTMIKCDGGKLAKIVKIGDENQVLFSELDEDKKLKSAFQGIAKSKLVESLNLSHGINVPTTGIISKRVYANKYKPTSEDLLNYKVERRPFCLIVDCSDGFEKKKKGDVIMAKNYMRGNSNISDVYTAANCAEAYCESGLSVTILTFYDKARLAIKARCHQIGLPDVFCNDFHITTVDQYQSGKDDHIILVMDRDDLHVQDIRRQNVAVTRARTHLTLICNSKTMQQPSYKDSILYDFYRHQHSQYIPASKFNDSKPDEIVALITLSTVKGDGEKGKSY